VTRFAPLWCVSAETSSPANGRRCVGEAIAPDNEALEIGEGVREPRPPYRAAKKRISAKKKAKR
jgi:hypothetical protein